MAAVLAAGDGAALTGMGGAALLRVNKRAPVRIDVLVPKPRKSQPGFVTHTCRKLDPRDVVIVDRIPVVTVARLVVGAGLPAPTVNVVINGFEVDAYWPGLCVEVDGFGHRRTRSQVEDRIKEAALRATGYTVLRFTEDDVDFRPAKVLAQLAAQQLPGRVAG